ncbi:galactoside alpha-(1,2)-fucosyltransferase 2 isoform X2 [Erythrolamprus reginae]|uniref:galactoside alpha-(1,2)-fucosyltransferase 2 isoform X2 n=1 Tax=Erythrolamprus reginae TaxID=121349 RepID=UPI00396C3844
MVGESWGKRSLSFVTIKHHKRGISNQFSPFYFVYILALLSLSVFFHLSEKISYYYTFSKTTFDSFLVEQILLQHITTNSSLSTEAIDAGMWTVNSIGRLGNQMGQYATLYALAKLNGYQAYIHPDMYLALSPIFKITLPVISAEMIWKTKWRNVYLHDWMSEDYRHIQGKYIQLIGYPCSYTFYHHIRQEILKEFTFHDHIKEEANRYLQILRGERQKVTYVGVHVRRGDYVQVMPQTWKGVVADKGYLEKAMDYFRKKYPNPIFVVTSNGMEWCKKNIDASRGDVHFAEDGKETSPGKDFALLSHCNHTIMTIGTFGIWAGYLAARERDTTSSSCFLGKKTPQRGDVPLPDQATCPRAPKEPLAFPSKQALRYPGTMPQQCMVGGMVQFRDGREPRQTLSLPPLVLLLLNCPGRAFPNGIHYDYKKHPS